MPRITRPILRCLCRRRWEADGAVRSTLTALALTIALGIALFTAPSIWGLYDISRTPETAWDAIGRRKSNWTVVFGVGVWFQVLGLAGCAVYLMKVRPALRAALVERGESLSAPRPPVWVAVVLLAGISMATGWLIVTAQRDAEPVPPGVVERANEVCTDAHAELAELPELPDSPTYEQRARAVERGLAVFEATVARLRALIARGRNSTYDEWLDRWDELNGAGAAYADAIRTGDRSVYEPAGDAADGPATAVASMASTHGMNACVF
jgi:hypothetical protein